jgi:hypothetical protein
MQSTASAGLSGGIKPTSSSSVMFPMTQPNIFPDFEIQPDDLTDDEF